MSDCSGPLHPQAKEGVQLFNEGKYFEAHEALENAWNATVGIEKNLYRGILQTAVVYLHVTRANYNGAVKVYGRSQKWFEGISDRCHGVHVREFRENAKAVMDEVYRLGEKKIASFDKSLLGKIEWKEKNRTYLCDRCGSEMYEKNCKVTCPNCGNRFDCSDLNIYFD